MAHLRKKVTNAKKRAKNELLARRLQQSTKLDKTTTGIKKPDKRKNFLPKGKRRISRQRKERRKFV